jgi:hypothetical protein
LVEISEAMALALAAAIKPLSLAQKAKLLGDPNTDPRIISAVLTMPAVLVDVPADLFNNISDRMTPDSKKQELVDHAEAIEQAEAVVQITSDFLARHADLTPHQFDRALNEATATTKDVAAKERAEHDRFVANDLLEQAKRLNSDAADELASGIHKASINARAAASGLQPVYP